MFNTVDKQKFEEIIKQVRSHGVSSHDVISFENMIGSNFITSSFKLNRFTQQRTGICAEDVISRAMACQKEIDEESTKYTVLDVCKLASNMYYNVKELSDSIERISNMIKDSSNHEKIERLVNEKWCYKWDDDRVIDLSKDNGIVNAFRWNRNYLQAVCPEAYSFDCILSDMESYVQNSNDNMGEYSPLFSTLYNNSFSYLFSNKTFPSPKEFYLNIHNCLSLFRNYHEDYSDNLKYLLSNILDIKQNYENKSRIFSIYDYREISNTYNQLQNVNALLNDELGTLTMKIFLRIFNK